MIQPNGERNREPRPALGLLPQSPTLNPNLWLYPNP